MIVRLRPGTDEERVQALRGRLGERGLRCVQSPEPARPILAVLGRVVVVAAVGLVERIDGSLLLRNSRTPRFDIVRQVCGLRRSDRSKSRGMVFVSVHAIAGRMDDR